MPGPQCRKSAPHPETGIARDHAQLKSSVIVTLLTGHPLLTLFAALAFGVLVFGRILP